MKLHLTFLIGLTLTAELLADIVPLPGSEPLRPAFDRSDVVCNCVVEALRVLEQHEIERNGKVTTQRRLAATVKVRDLYKASTARGTLEVEYSDAVPETSGSTPTLSIGELGLLFLKVTKNSGYEFSDPFLGVTPFSAIPQLTGPFGLSKLEAALAAILDANVREDRINALRLLQGMDEFSAETVAKLNQLASSDDPDLALSAIAVLLKDRSAVSVNRLESYLTAYKRDEQPLALLSIGTELRQVRDVNALSSLEALSSSRYLAVRLGAMDAIRSIRNPNSARVLIERLDDSSTDIQYIAVIALAEIFRKDGDYAPTMDLFDQNRQFYTNLWKTWWLQGGESLTK